MKCFVLGAISLVLALPANAEEAPLRVIPPNTTSLNGSPTGAQAAYVQGAPQQNGLYVILARYVAGSKGAPHSHPDQRVVTVLSGTLYIGTGPSFDEASARPMPAGTILVIPAGTLHWSWAKDGDVLSEEVGIGPTSNQFPAK